MVTPQFKVTKKTLSNTIKKKIFVAGNSVTNALRSNELSAGERSVTVMKHPGCSTEDMTDDINPFCEEKARYHLITHGNK